ncbi:MAG: hypothetical protein JRN34_05700 [Nitrososphaerota archaeon]|nr:hypothetical protein [Nitrososphaerota archaeon]MDG6950820.1 hypothetical protein [Nitrososphaerota archaeon]
MPYRSRAASISLALLALILVAPWAVAQTSFTLTISTDKPSYVNGQAIHVTGKVSPPPGPNTAVFLEIINPHGSIVAPGEAPVGASTGLYNYTFVAGGTSGWTSGTYEVNATWGAYPPQIYAGTTFQYAPTTVTTSTSSASTTFSTAQSTSSASTSSTSTTFSTSSSTAISASSTSSTKGGGGIPEFPFQAALAAFFVFVIASAYLIAKKASARTLPAVTT